MGEEVGRVSLREARVLASGSLRSLLALPIIWLTSEPVSHLVSFGSLDCKLRVKMELPHDMVIRPR